MEIDWAYVKTKTLWHYEALIEKIFSVLAYSFVQEHYNHTMEEAVNFAQRIKLGYLQNGKQTSFISEITDHFNTLGNLDVKNYLDLVRKIETRVKCKLFVQKTNFRFESLIQILNFVFRWVLPFKCSVRELVDITSDANMAALEVLMKCKIRSNLDVLEACRTRADRSQLAREAGITEAFILDLVHRADISRLAYVRGKTVKHLCGGGYDTLDKIANSDLIKMEEDMTAYYRTMGKSFSNFKAVIPLNWMIGGAKVLPKIIDG